MHGDYWDLNHNVTFDGENKIIVIADGITSIEVVVDLYSNWKEWAIIRDNLKYDSAFSAIGGQQTVPGQVLGTTIFLVNGWRVRTWEGDHTITVNGNMYVDGGGEPFLPTLFPHTIVYRQVVSNLFDRLLIPSTTDIRTELSTELNEVSEVHKIHGLDQSNPAVVTSTTRDAGSGISQTFTEVSGVVTIQRL